MKIEVTLSPEQQNRLLVGLVGDYARRFHRPAMTEEQAGKLVAALLATMIGAPQVVFDRVAADVLGPVPEKTAPGPFEAYAVAVRAEQLRELSDELALAEAVRVIATKKGVRK